jgi:ABC-type nitrate/sulfonate/bicarbonate transport system permease component
MAWLSPPPALAIILLLSLIYGALFHLWKGSTWQDFVISIFAATIGMALGLLIGPFLGFGLLKMGQVYLLEGTILAWGLMLAVAWLKG